MIVVHNMTRKRTIVLATGVIAAVTYSAFYLTYRMQKHIVHFKSWSDHNHHRVEAVYPYGRLLFVNLLVNSLDESNEVSTAKFEQLEEASMKYLVRRHRVISIVFAPLMWAETLFWYLVDFKRDI